MKGLILFFYFFFFLLRLDAFGQTEYYPYIQPNDIDFGTVKVGEYRDAVIIGIYYPQHYYAGPKIARVELGGYGGDTVAFSIDKHSITLQYSDILEHDTLHVRFRPNKVGHFQGDIEVKMGSDFSNCSLHGNSVTSNVSSNGNGTTTSIPPKNFPNPVTTKTTFSFTMPQEEFTTLKIYNPLGIEVTTLINKKLSAGDQSIEFDASHLPSGVYYYRLQIGGHSETKPMVVAH